MEKKERRKGKEGRMEGAERVGRGRKGKRTEGTEEEVRTKRRRRKACVTRGPGRRRTQTTRTQSHTEFMRFSEKCLGLC